MVSALLQLGQTGTLLARCLSHRVEQVQEDNEHRSGIARVTVPETVAETRGVEW